ncbi:MAG: Non-canonical purine NTP pyrophosphatase [Candidatus Uhrbacteria bacterium GW2011_GWE2_40_58]|nr:MAG: Non-canonical purine NTP pyrophosphatase [Candidatus Uhrbacteria bacterium GW2011_GWF2_40_263]KKR68231.1 MAG: Non-canonical purine NTP pyrophosphatase [Candidatus Uhrbacteria bacterium GW2011_GWE2_40_58]OGL94157.1 MAG: non-canonical purine NTP pyrophosphatase, RdgB/HAM1 family [Candidatus Uhrbacteria bacterium RIFOXYA2_FULL_40_9]OGL97491.1 MAG: non-canonical purine NTP pyrophosphatase, RdgB/HAM1 family [Candidatus Uhrbacteria bacterium RIFOXYB2_FULL_41_18]
MNTSFRHFFLGTTNPNKIQEIGAILTATGCTYEPTDPINPEETESDFVGNALLKARAYAAHAGGPTICEDSGLIIPALGGLPGPWSARFSEFEKVDVEHGLVSSYSPSGLSRDRIDPMNNQRVLELMRGIEMPRRAAMFKVVFVVALPDGSILCQCEGESHGWIAEVPRGTNGFGYDSIFVGQQFPTMTYAEVDSVRKNLVSHRKKALQLFKAWLGNYLKSHE